jgi:hypothetical protein
MFSTADGFTKNRHAYDGHGDSVDSTSSQPADRPKTVELNRGLRKPAEQVSEPKKEERELQHEFAAELEQLKEVSARSHSGSDSNEPTMSESLPYTRCMAQLRNATRVIHNL